MKTSNIKKQLNREFDSITPKQGQKLLNTTLQSSKNKKIPTGKGELNMRTNKKIAIGAIAACCVIALVLGLIFGLKDDEVAMADSYVVIDVNPSIELTVDENNVVTSVSAGNTDAQVLLQGETGIVGEDVETATQKIISLSVEYGYLTEDNLDISISVTSNSAEVQAKIKEAVSASIVKGAGSLSVTVNATANILATKQVEKLKAANPDNENYQNLTPEKYRLIVRARACDRTLTMDAAVALSDEELIARVQNAVEYRNQKFMAIYGLAQTSALYAYEDAKQLAYDSAYYNAARDSILGGNIWNGATRAVYASQYLVYREIARALTHAADLISLYRENPVITSNDILNTLNMFGVTEEEANAFVADMAAYGDITKENILKYINDLSADLTANDAKINVAVNVYNGADAYASVVANVDLGAVSTYLGAAVGKLGELTGAVFSFNLSELVTIDDVNAKIAQLNTKADEALANMEITEEEQESITALQNGYANRFAAAEQAYNELKINIEAQITAQKQARKEAREQQENAGENNANGNA